MDEIWDRNPAKSELAVVAGMNNNKITIVKVFGVVYCCHFFSLILSTRK